MNAFNQAVVSLFATEKRSLGNTLSGLFPFMGASTKEGRKINAYSSLKISAFWCGVNAIASSVALLPKNVYRKNGDVRELSPDHPVHYLIHDEPNSYMTAYVFWFIMTVAMLLRGNGFALIERNGGGAVNGLKFLHPDDVTVYEYQEQLFYKYKNITYFASEIYHLPGFSFNGILGIGVVQYAADNLSVSLSADEFASNSYSDRATTYGVAESDHEINGIGAKNIETTFNNALVASNRKHRVAVLDEGLKYRSLGLKPQESEFIKAKAAGVEDVARWLNIPLHKLHASGEGGYNFLVEMSQEYLSSTIAPIGEKIKQENHRKLFSKAERKAGYYVMLNYRKLLETNPKARAEYYKSMIYAKVMNPNEVRELEDMNPYEDGEQFLQMTNLLNQEQVKKLEDGQAA